jgi:glutamate racemase
VQDRLAAAALRVIDFVDGTAGIARRALFLTRDQSWPEKPAAGTIVFTAQLDTSHYFRVTLAERGLEHLETL